MHLCSYCSTICWNSFLFLIKFSSKFCWKSIGFSFMNLFMDSILYHWSICVFVFCYYTLLITVGLWDFIFLGSQITADGDCSHEIKRRLLLGRKLMTNLDSILKSRDITLPTKFSLVKAMVFQWSCMDVRVGLWRRLSTKESMLLNCGVGEDSWESLGLQEDATSPF